MTVGWYLRVALDGLRKCRLGNAGRFSTDLNFSAPDDDVVVEVCGLIDGARVGGFEFGIVSNRGDGRHWGLKVSHAELGEPRIAASVEFARRPLALPPEPLRFVPCSPPPDSGWCRPKRRHSCSTPLPVTQGNVVGRSKPSACQTNCEVQDAQQRVRVI